MYAAIWSLELPPSQGGGVRERCRGRGTRGMMTGRVWQPRLLALCLRLLAPPTNHQSSMARGFWALAESPLLLLGTSPGAAADYQPLRSRKHTVVVVRSDEQAAAAATPVVVVLAAGPVVASRSLAAAAVHSSSQRVLNGMERHPPPVSRAAAAEIASCRRAVVQAHACSCLPCILGRTPTTRGTGGSDAQAERSTPQTSLCAEGATG
jgi:hypothetical protein